ncbi:peptidyl-prolyl cis-trans isomerase [Arcobacter sp. LA11]|uniref:peptidylprolyl isomerase n=1 Tax=Arcobacter sp. LA11 TaxID=1898176 RepID=UPI0009F86C3C|nr:peptidyl-prolyl cis-trans isomerase [Arcobacter sp. LA11]
MKLLFTVLILLGLATQSYAQKVFATVNNEAITIKDINAMLKAFKEQRSFSELPQEQRNLIINQTIENKILQQNAKKEGIENDPSYLAALNSFKSKMLVETWMKNNYANLQISESEIKDYYDKNKSEFDKKEQVKARHIVVEKKEEAQALIKKLNASKDVQKTFIELAKNKSIGPSAPKGGDLGWFGKGTMLEAFWEEAKNLSENSYSKKPIKTNYGWHIVFVDGKQPAYTVELEQIKPVIENKIKMKKFQSVISKKIDKLKKEAIIKK